VPPRTKRSALALHLNLDKRVCSLEVRHRCYRLKSGIHQALASQT
jgi:hypothetical protein